MNRRRAFIVVMVTVVFMVVILFSSKSLRIPIKPIVQVTDALALVRGLR